MKGKKETYCITVLFLWTSLPKNADGCLISRVLELIVDLKVNVF